ncbi:MAG: hypothetical protein AAGM22_21605 [Acidobacteriota bacterium]
MLALFCAGPSTAEQAEPLRNLTVESGGKVLEIRPQTPEEAYAYLAGLHRDMDFFKANGYDVALPNHPAFAADAESLGSVELFADEVYRLSAFETALGVLAEKSSTLRDALAAYESFEGLEGFRSFDRYRVTLTLYGPGGSYHPDSGGIVLLTTPDGRFKGGGGVHTIVHEMMHLAVEDGLVQRFGLSHWEKERLVDFLVKREFRELLPNYELQSSGADALGPYLAEAPISAVADALRRYRADRESQKPEARSEGPKKHKPTVNAPRPGLQ